MECVSGCNGGECVCDGVCVLLSMSVSWECVGGSEYGEQGSLTVWSAEYECVWCEEWRCEV